jgi:hypothetical protein
MQLSLVYNMTMSSLLELTKGRSPDQSHRACCEMWQPSTPVATRQGEPQKLVTAAGQTASCIEHTRRVLGPHLALHQSILGHLHVLAVAGHLSWALE